jgi:formylglycine-generating enzyme required for sulfatase activity
MMLALDPAVRCTVGEAFHRLTGPWIRLPNGDTIGSDLVWYEDWRSVMGATGVNSGGYVVQVSHDEIKAFCQRTGSRLPTLAELQWLATGTETQKASRDRPSRLVSDYGAAQCRRAVWQPTSDGYLFGGTAYADTDVQAGTPEAGNRMIGLRIVHETKT